MKALDCIGTSLVNWMFQLCMMTTCVSLAVVAQLWFSSRCKENKEWSDERMNNFVKYQEMWEVDRLSEQFVKAGHKPIQSFPFSSSVAFPPPPLPDRLISLSLLLHLLMLPVWFRRKIIGNWEVFVFYWLEIWPYILGWRSQSLL